MVSSSTWERILLRLHVPWKWLLCFSFNGTQAYAQSKLANIMHAKELARRLRVCTTKHAVSFGTCTRSKLNCKYIFLQGRNAMVTINAVHPGVVKTGIIRDHKGLITGIYERSVTITSIESNENCWLYISYRFGVLPGIKATEIDITGLDDWFLLFRMRHEYSHASYCYSLLQGASTTCYVALSPQLIGVSGKYFVDCNETSCSSLAGNEFEARTLWQKTHALVREHVRQTRRAKT